MNERSWGLVVAVMLVLGLGTVPTVTASPGVTGTVTDGIQDTNGTLDGNATASRTGDQVVFQVPATTVTASPENASLEVRRADSSAANLTITGSDKDGTGGYQFTTTTGEIESSLYDGSLTNSSVRLTLLWNQSNRTEEYTNNHTVTVDVRSFSFSQKSIRVDGTRVLLPVDVVGYGTDDTVPVAVRNERQGQTTTFDGRIVNGSETMAIVVSIPDVFSGQVSPLGQVRFTAYPQDQPYLQSSKRTDLRQALGASKSTIQSSDDDISVEHPLLFADESYVINAQTSSGRYVNRVTATAGEGGGQVALPAGLLTTDRAVVTVTHVDASGNRTWVVRNLQLASRSQPDSLTYANGAFTFGNGLPGTVQSVWLRHDGEVWQATTVNTSGSNLSLAPLRGSGSYQVIVVGANGIRRGMADVDTPASQPTGNAPAGVQNPAGTDGLFIELITAGFFFLIAFGLFLVLSLLFDASPTEGGVIVAILLLALWAILFLSLGGIFEIPIDAVDNWLTVAIGGIAIAGVVTGTWGGSNHFRVARFGIGSLIFATLGTLFAASLASNSSILPVAAVVFGPWAGLAILWKLSSDGPTEHTVTVELVDQQNQSRTVDLKTEVTAEYEPTGERKTFTVDGQSRVKLPSGKWTFEAGSGVRAPPKTETVRNSTPVTIPVRREELQFAVETDGGNGIEGATVRVQADGVDERLRTNASGLTDPVGFPGDVPEVSVDVSHDYYSPRQQMPTTVPVKQDEPKRIEMVAQTGTIDATVTIDGTRVDGVTVVATATDGAPVASSETRRKETDTRGTIRLTAPVGTYKIRPELPGGTDAFECPTKRVTVDENVTRDVTLSISFTYDLPQATERRIADIRDQLETATSHPRIDMSIPVYYGSVIEELLATIEGIPTQGAAFASADRSPDVVVEALLAAADDGVAAIKTAMSSKQTTELFAACQDMDPVNGGWSGSFTVTELLEVAEEDPGSRRSRIGRQVDAVNDRIDDELRDLSEVSPARDMWSETRDLVSKQRRDNLEEAATVLLAEGFLDAIETLFERHELRERMTRTVF